MHYFLYLFLELLIRLPQNVTVMEGDNATLCVYFSSEFKSNFNIDVRHLLSNSTLDDEPGKSFHRISLKTRLNPSINANTSLYSRTSLFQ